MINPENKNVVEDDSFCYVPQSVHKLLDYILSLSLSSENQRWLADHLYENVNGKDKNLALYSKEELMSRINEAEEQIARGEVSTHEDVMKRAYDRVKISL